MKSGANHNPSLQMTFCEFLVQLALGERSEEWWFGWLVARLVAWLLFAPAVVTVFVVTTILLLLLFLLLLIF